MRKSTDGFTQQIHRAVNVNRIYTILPKVLAPPSNEQVTTIVISMSTNLNVKAYNDILGNCVLLIL